MKKTFIILIVIFITLNLFSSITHIWPSSGVNDTTITVHIFGDGFNSGVTNVDLYKSGNPLITGSNISVVNDNYLTCEFDLSGTAVNNYNLIVNSDTLNMCFTINKNISYYSYKHWDKTDLGAGDLWMARAVVEDGDNDGELEVYSACYDHHLYQFRWNGNTWIKVDIGSGANYMLGVTVGDVDNDGFLEVYGANFDHHIYKFNWNGSSWDKTDIGSGGGELNGVSIGDGNNDGELEIYGACSNNHIYQFKWNGSSWEITDIGSGTSLMHRVAVGDGDNDGFLEVYGSSWDNHIYQFKWNGSSWIKTDVGFGSDWMKDVAVGDGNNDGDFEVYGACRDYHIYQFKWTGSTWNKTDVGFCGSSMDGVVVGDGNNDGEMELYVSSADYNLWQFKWDGSGWIKTYIGNGGLWMYGVAVGDGNNDGALEIYGCNGDYHLYQYKVVPDPKLGLVDTFYDFLFTNDTSHWQYLILENIGDSFLIVDSIISTSNYFSTYNLILPDTVNVDDSSLVDVIFSPSEECFYAGTLAVYSNDPYDNVQIVYLQGTGDFTSPTNVNLVSPHDSAYLNNNIVDFTWSKSTDTLAGIDYYNLQISFDYNFNTGLIDTNNIDTIINLNLIDSIYYWHIKAYDRAGNESQWSEVWYFEVDTDNPSIPYLYNPVGGSFYSNDTVDFSWSVVMFKDSESPVRYVIEIDSLVNFTTPMTVDTVDINTIEKILIEDFYYWHVKAFDLAGNESPFSATDSFGVDMTPPMIESTTVWTDTSFAGPFTINVKITDNSEVDTCLLYYKRVEDPSFQITELSSTGGNWFEGEIPQAYLNPDTVKYYIYAKDISNPANESYDPAGAPTSYYSFIVNSVGISEILEIPAIFTFSYSYPSAGEIIFNLAIPEVSDISLKIFDISGREVSNLISGQLSPAFYNIPFRPLSKGTYFYRLESSYQNKNGKFIIVE